MPPVFGLPPAIQKMSVKLASARAALSALVALESLTNSTRPWRPIGCMRWARPGNVARPFLDGGEVEAERDAGGDGAGRVLRIVRAAQRADAGEIGDRRGLAVLRAA